MINSLDLKVRHMDTLEPMGTLGELVTKHGGIVYFDKNRINGEREATVISDEGIGFLTTGSEGLIYIRNLGSKKTKLPSKNIDWSDYYAFLDSKMDSFVGALKQAYPEAGISFGYIGNCSNHLDDRCWYVFTKIPKLGGGGNYSFGGYPTDNFGEFVYKVHKDFVPWLKSRNIYKIK